MSVLKVEFGRWYQMRNGEHFYAAVGLKNGWHRVLGIHLFENGFTEKHCVNFAGKANAYSLDEHPYDLLAECDKPEGFS